MPLVKIDLHAGKDAEFRRKLSDAVHDAMVTTIDVPVADKFQIITEHRAGVRQTDCFCPARFKPSTRTLASMNASSP